MIMKHPHVQSKQTTKLVQDLKNATHQPQVSPLLFRVYGKRGVGKKTLVNELNKIFSSEFQCSKISFGLNSPIKILIDLMTVFDRQLVGDPNEWKIEDFKELKDKYETTCQSLVDSAAKEEYSNNKDKVRKSTEQFLKTILPSVIESTGVGTLAASIGKPLSNIAVDTGFSHYDSLRKNKLIKNNLELQDLVENPLPKLAQAFVKTIIQKSRYKPILLLIGNHEKAPWEFDSFLCQYILSNQELQNSPIRIVMTGELSLKNERYKKRYQQHNNLISDRQLKDFDFEETENYLAKIGITNNNHIRRCWNATKGYPYHLNLIRQQKEDQEKIHLSYGVKEMLKMLLDGLNDIERKVIILAAYCRWFDEQTIEYLLKKNNIKVNSPDHANWFEWLISRGFVKEDKYYHLDDVARNIIRQAEHKSNKQQFRDIHEQLADYYQELASIEIENDEFSSEKYQCAEWCDYIIRI